MKTKQILILSAVIINFIAVSCNVGIRIQKHYNEKLLIPVYIDKLDDVNIPDEFHIKGITCISYKNAYCASAALQMIAEQKGNPQSIDYVNWLMGFSYSFYFVSANGFALPYYDPETGYIEAAPYLGLKRNYLVSNDSMLYLSNLRKQLSMNTPLRVAINSSALQDKKGYTPHSILVVGYSKDSIFYFETGIKDRRLQNYDGEKVCVNIFLKSVRSMSENANYPWIYNMTFFESGNQDKDLNKIWERISKNMIGQSFGPVSSGSKAIKNFSSYLKKTELKEGQYKKYTAIFDMGIYTRSDNGNFIRSNFTNPKFIKVADLFDKSSDLFKKAKLAMLEKDKDLAIEKLNEISEIEFSIGKLLLDKND